MKQRNHFIGRERRDFFKKAAVMGAAALFTGAQNRRPAAAAPVPAPIPQNRSGYRLTAHIRTYYERASF
jgi:hypothetical protein